MGYLTGKRLYLSGPIEHESGVDWRVEPKKVLAGEFGIEIFDPRSDPKQEWVPTLNKARETCDYDKMREIARDFVSKDLTVVSRSDIVIANLPYKVPTFGTTHEIINSVDDKKPTLLLCEKGKQFIPFWFWGVGQPRHFFSTWEEVYAYLREVNDGKHTEDRRWRYIYGLI